MKTSRALAGLALFSVLALSACGGDGDDDPTIAVPTDLTSSAAAAPADAPGVRTIPAAEAAPLLEQQGVRILDVRTPAEFEAGHLQDAVNVPLADDYESAIAAYDRAAPYVLYCRTGNRSAQAAEIMRGLGFTDVVDAGGFDDLVSAGAEKAA